MTTRGKLTVDARLDKLLLNVQPHLELVDSIPTSDFTPLKEKLGLLMGATTLMHGHISQIFATAAQYTPTEVIPEGEKQRILEKDVEIFELQQTLSRHQFTYTELEIKLRNAVKEERERQQNIRTAITSLAAEVADPVQSLARLQDIEKLINRYTQAAIDMLSLPTRTQFNNLKQQTVERIAQRKLTVSAPPKTGTREILPRTAKERSALQLERDRLARLKEEQNELWIQQRALRLNALNTKLEANDVEGLLLQTTPNDLDAIANILDHRAAWMRYELDAIMAEVKETIDERTKTWQTSNPPYHTGEITEDDVDEFRVQWFDVDKPDLEIKPSTIAAAGNGLFTTRALFRNEPITEYTGQFVLYKDILRRERATPPETFNYLLTIEKDLVTQLPLIVIDGQRDEQGALITDATRQRKGFGWAAFANDAVNVRPLPPPLQVEFLPDKINATLMTMIDANVPLIKNDDAALRQRYISFIYALGYIPPGEEIFVSYSENYWMGERPKTRTSSESTPTSASTEGEMK